MKQAAVAPISRRKLLGGLALAATAAGAEAAPAVRLARGRIAGPGRPLAHAGVEEWQRQIGSELRIRPGQGVQVPNPAEGSPRERLPRRGRGRARAFAAAFRARSGPLPA